MLSLFRDDEGGFTSLSAVCALLVSLSLVFSLVQVRWILVQSSSIQSVADVCAMSGEQVVRGFLTIADVCDACITTMSLTGIVVAGVGLVTCAIPGCGAQGLEIVAKGREILKARTEFAQSCVAGLQKVEATLPYLIVANSFTTVSENSDEDVTYSGVCIPYPQTSESKYDAVVLIDDSELQERAESLAEASDALKEAKEEADAAKEIAYRADCVDDPMCMFSRARDLASLTGVLNPYYASCSDWTFGVALLRARSYYSARAANESSAGLSPTEVTKSELRRTYYLYALAEMSASSYTETSSSVSIDFRELARNTETTRNTSMYTDACWPYTTINGKTVLHSSSSCPDVEDVEGYGSLAEQEAGIYGECATCGLTLSEMGRVASASTNINNGFEHYWRIVVEQSEIYESAKSKQLEAESELKNDANEVLVAFEKAVSELAPPDFKLCPAGAWGCIGFVCRSEVSTPEEMIQAFSSTGDLPAGVAISGAVLAPDDSDSTNSILIDVVEKLSAGTNSESGILAGVVTLWSDSLSAYAAAYGTVSSAANKMFDGIEKIGLSSVSNWLKTKLGDVVASLGIKAADIRQKKPVLCSTQEILNKSGSTDSQRLTSYIEGLPNSGTCADYVRALGRTVFDEMRSDGFVLAELPIPGTDLTVPLTIDVKKLAGLIL